MNEAAKASSTTRAAGRVFDLSGGLVDGLNALGMLLRHDDPTMDEEGHLAALRWLTEKLRSDAEALHEEVERMHFPGTRASA
jgi:hypothetical protein